MSEMPECLCEGWGGNGHAPHCTALAAFQALQSRLDRLTNDKLRPMTCVEHSWTSEEECPFCNAAELREALLTSRKVEAQLVERVAVAESRLDRAIEALRHIADAPLAPSERGVASNFANVARFALNNGVVERQNAETEELLSGSRLHSLEEQVAHQRGFVAAWRDVNELIRRDNLDEMFTMSELIEKVKVALLGHGAQ